MGSRRKQIVYTISVVHIDKMLAECASLRAFVNGVVLDEFVQDILVERFEEPDGYDTYVREKILESMANDHSGFPFYEAVKEVQLIIDKAVVKASA